MMIPYAQKYLSFFFFFFLPNKNLCSYDQQQQIDSSRFIEKTCYHCFIQWLFFKSLTYTRKLLKDYHCLVYSPFPPPSPSLFHSSFPFLSPQQQKLILLSFLITNIYMYHSYSPPLLHIFNLHAAIFQ